MTGVLKMVALFLALLALAWLASSVVAELLQVGTFGEMLVGMIIGVPAGVIPVQVAVSRGWIFN